MLGSKLSLIWHYQRQNLRRIAHSPRLNKQQDEQLYRRLATAPDAATMSSLVLDYCWTAQCRYRDRHHTLAYYPGYPSIYGARNDAIEGVSRLLPLWAAWLGSAADPLMGADDASRHDAFRQACLPLAEDVRAHVRVALLNGTNPAHPGYWGPIGDRSTLICEGADIALAAWLLRDSLPELLGQEGLVQLVNWLRQAVSRETVDNNWHLFVVLIDKVLAALDPSHAYTSAARYERVRLFYRGDGCFSDGPEGALDLYNAWGFHYVLFWLDQIDPDFDPAFIREAVAEYVAWFQYLFTDDGVVLYGRSLPYRMAMPVPVMAAAHLVPSEVSRGLALACYHKCWRAFLAHGCVRHGRPTQGVFDDNPVWLDPYSGPASAFWSLRSMVMYYYLQREFAWAAVAECPLPATVESRSLSVRAPGAEVRTQGREGPAQLVFTDNTLKLDAISLQHPSPRERLRAAVYGSGVRPANNLHRLGLRCFHSDLREYAALQARDNA